MQRIDERHSAELHDFDGIELHYDERRTAHEHVRQILEEARARGHDDLVAEGLVGADLQLRCPALSIRHGWSSDETERSSGWAIYEIGDTTFHVTVSPAVSVFKKCSDDVSEGKRVYLLVPGRLQELAQSTADAVAPGRYVVEAIESFVAVNLDVLAQFSTAGLLERFRELITIYNRHADQAERDKTLWIELRTSAG